MPKPQPPLARLNSSLGAFPVEVRVCFTPANVAISRFWDSRPLAEPRQNYLRYHEPACVSDSVPIFQTIPTSWWLFSHQKANSRRQSCSQECARQDQGTVSCTKGADLQGLQLIGMNCNILLANGFNSVNAMIHSIWHQRLVPQHPLGDHHHWRVGNINSPVSVPLPN